MELTSGNLNTFENPRENGLVRRIRRGESIPKKLCDGEAFGQEPGNITPVDPVMHRIRLRAIIINCNGDMMEGKCKLKML